MREDEDPLRPAEGIALCILLGIFGWGVLFMLFMLFSNPAPSAFPPRDVTPHVYKTIRPKPICNQCHKEII